MKRVLPWVLLALASCSEDSPPPTASATGAVSQPLATGTAPVLSWDGYGPIQFGMKLEDAEQVAGGRTDAGRPLNEGCDYTTFSSLPGVRFMVENGVVTRGDAEPGIPNAVDVAVEDSLASVGIAHPEAELMPHKYDPTGQYVLFRSPAGDRAILLETQKEIVALIRAGLEPAVQYVESCG